MNLLFLIGVDLIFISQFFIPAARYNYYNIIWLIPLSLIILNSESISSLLNPLIILLFMGLFFSISMPFAPGGLIISDIAIVFYVVLSTIYLFRKNWRKEHNKLL